METFTSIVVPVFVSIVLVLQMVRIYKLKAEVARLDRLLMHKRIAESVRTLRERADFIE